jgi:hypothetical protein
VSHATIAEGCLGGACLDFRIKVEKRVKAALELCFDLFPRALNHVHGDMSLVAVRQLEGCVLDFCDFAFRQQSESVDKSQICHKTHHNDGGQRLDST